VVPREATDGEGKRIRQRGEQGEQPKGQTASWTDGLCHVSQKPANLAGHALSISDPMFI
jgi:hypothetical protein